MLENKDSIQRGIYLTKEETKLVSSALSDYYSNHKKFMVAHVEKRLNRVLDLFSELMDGFSRPLF